MQQHRRQQIKIITVTVGQALAAVIPVAVILVETVTPEVPEDRT